MPRYKPHGWPRYMLGKPLKDGSVGYYWNAPTWAVKAGCPVQREALGTDYGTAKQRCDEILNKQFDDWRTGGEPDEIFRKIQIGTFDWLVAEYKNSRQFRNIADRTRRSYEAVLQLVSNHVLQDGRRFGTLSLASITPKAADLLFEKLETKSDGEKRTRTALLAMRICQRAWGVAYRAHSRIVSAENPFAKMDLSYTPKTTRPVS